MKLPYPRLSLADALAEFDIWITPSTGEIRDTERFQQELDRVTKVFEVIAKATSDYRDIDHCAPAAIARTVASTVAGKSVAETVEFLESFAAVLFLVTGKSDNNGKCQLPLHLRDSAGWTEFPFVQRGVLSFKPIPRELKAEKYMKVVSDLQHNKAHQEKLLNEFCRYVLSDERYVAQLWSIGKSFVLMRELGREKDLLTPLVVFQVRGSVSASGGHGPEDILRDRLTEWGLERGVDFNTSDVVISPPTKGETRTKTRAYDFVLPYSTPGWTKQVFIQCQFYAGDSGSVSHKNVDQTSTSRVFVTPIHNNARFVEYLDGAGYFSSLNGDLKSLLSMTNTASFFQIRTAPIRLRRELQQIGFLTPLDVEHGILIAGGEVGAVQKHLIREGYTKGEIDRCIRSALSRDVITGNVSSLAIRDDRRVLARRMLILDTICCHGVHPDGPLAGYVFAPGNGRFNGMKMDELIAKVIEIAPCIRLDWDSPTRPLEDLRWLSEMGYTISR